MKSFFVIFRRKFLSNNSFNPFPCCFFFFSISFQINLSKYDDQTLNDAKKKQNFLLHTLPLTARSNAMLSVDCTNPKRKMLSYHQTTVDICCQRAAPHILYHFYPHGGRSPVIFHLIRRREEINIYN